ncbi:jg13573 [Pararge aegeria aegeria]|uniref:Jg13573 protein n=1 Tax=Pararge aegeria aegeria TaxID=348720 RepID=A0A8S4QWI1_9NEOP|nr:jg13573 [Pararge aegeria aegeria]
MSILKSHIYEKQMPTNIFVWDSAEDNTLNTEEKNASFSRIQTLNAPADDDEVIEKCFFDNAVELIEATVKKLIDEPEEAEPIVETIVEPTTMREEDDSVGEFMHEEIDEE